MQHPQTATILLVDDDLGTLELFAKSLHEADYRVSAVSTLADALRHLALASPGLILSDVRLGDGSGIELLAYSKQVFPEIPIVLMTGYASVAAAVEALRLGAVDYLEKPLDIDTVTMVVRRYLRPISRDPRVERVLRVIESGPALPGFVPQLADSVGLSESRLRHLFKRETGQPLARYVMRARLMRAARALTTTDERVSSIAYVEGFQTASHFVRAFRAYWGVSPGQYRRRNARQPR